MKTKKGVIAVATLLFMATPFFGAMAVTTVKPHKVVLKNLTFDSIDTTAKTITAHSGTNTSYTISYSTKTKFVRASGEKFKVSGFLEFWSDDSITVWGTTVDGTNINSSKIRNNSTRKMKGKYITTIAQIISIPAGAPLPPGILGEFIAVKNTNQFQEVVVYGYTEFKFGKRKTTYASLQAGDVVDLKGISRNFGPATLIYNTTQVVVKSHGTPPANLFPSFFKFNNTRG